MVWIINSEEKGNSILATMTIITQKSMDLMEIFQENISKKLFNCLHFKSFANNMQSKINLRNKK